MLFFGLKIEENPIEQTYIKGKLRKSSVIEIKRTNFIKYGSILFVVGLTLRLLITLLDWG